MLAEGYLARTVGSTGTVASDAATQVRFNYLKGDIMLTFIYCAYLLGLNYFLFSTMLKSDYLPTHKLVVFTFMSLMWPLTVLLYHTTVNKKDTSYGTV